MKRILNIWVLPFYMLFYIFICLAQPFTYLYYLVTGKGNYKKMLVALYQKYENKDK